MSLRDVPDLSGARKQTGRSEEEAEEENNRKVTIGHNNLHNHCIKPHNMIITNVMNFTQFLY